ncbi:MAG: hypothetical protein U0232_27690 [Thermomicrobiales bacterium]
MASSGSRRGEQEEGRGSGGGRGTRGVAVGDGKGGATVERGIQRRIPSAEAGEALAEEGVRAVEVAAFEHDMAEFAEDAGGFEVRCRCRASPPNSIEEGRSTRGIVLGIGNLTEREAECPRCRMGPRIAQNAQGFGEVAARTGEIAAHGHHAPEAEEWWQPAPGCRSRA